MMRVLLFLALLVATPAGAQSLFDRATGLYGSPTDPAQSCKTNPHKLEFIANPAHALFTWQHPVPDRVGTMRDRARYDILDFDDTSMTLRLEGPDLRTDSGARAVWILRLTSNPAGYCWGRTDWPVVRCVDPAVKCGDDTPTS